MGIPFKIIGIDCGDTANGIKKTIQTTRGCVSTTTSGNKIGIPTAEAHNIRNPKASKLQLRESFDALKQLLTAK